MKSRVLVKLDIIINSGNANNNQYDIIPRTNAAISTSGLYLYTRRIKLKHIPILMGIAPIVSGNKKAFRSKNFQNGTIQLKLINSIGKNANKNALPSSTLIINAGKIKNTKDPKTQ